MVMVGDLEAGLAIWLVERVAKVVGGLGLNRVKTMNCCVLDLEGVKQAEHAWKGAFVRCWLHPRLHFIWWGSYPGWPRWSGRWWWRMLG